VSEFFSYFIISTFVTSVGMAIILLVKKLLKNHISARWQYNLGFLYFVLLIVPFIPGNFFSSFNMGDWVNPLRIERDSLANATAAGGGEVGLVYETAWLQDFAIAVNRPGSEYISVVFMGIWIIGIVIFAVIMLFCNRKLRLVKESVKPMEDSEMLLLFSRCKTEIGVNGKVSLGSSIMVKTPMTIGFFKPFIILPAAKISLEDARYAMLHELSHCKNKDIQINSAMCLFQVLFWFNPLVYFAFYQMRVDRELACDASILEMLPPEFHINYGGTLLNFVNRLSRPSMLLLAADMGGSKPQIAKRVKHIAAYATESGLLRAKSIIVFALMVILVFSKIPIISTLANVDDNRFHFRAANILLENFSRFFDGREGSFVLYDLNAEVYTIHNMNMSTTRVSPNSTYKIVSALIALETGVLEADNTFREWDGTVHPFKLWNQNQHLTSAMQSSANWYFQDFDAAIGLEQLRSYLTRLSYGNSNLSGGIADFWIESSLRISPIEQVEFLRNLHQNNIVFDTVHIDTMKDALQLYERDGAVLSGKTGTGFVNSRITNGWFIGYVETSGNTFIFATYIQGEENTGGSFASQITLSILEEQGVF